MIPHSRSPIAHTLHPALQHTQLLASPVPTKHALLITVLLLPPSFAPRHTAFALHPPPTLPTLRLVIVCQPSNTVGALLQSVCQQVREEEGEGGWGEVRGLGVFSEGYKVRESYRVEDVFERGERVLVTASSSTVSETQRRAAQAQENLPGELEVMRDGRAADGTEEANKQVVNGSRDEPEQPARKKPRTTPQLQPINSRMSPALQPLPPPPPAPTPATPRTSAMLAPPNIPSRPPSTLKSAQSAPGRRGSAVQSPRLSAVAASGSKRAHGVAASKATKDKSHLPLDVETDEEEEEDARKSQNGKHAVVQQHNTKTEEKVEGKRKEEDSKTAAASESKEANGKKQKGAKQQTQRKTNGKPTTNKAEEMEVEEPATQQLQQSSQSSLSSQHDDEDLPGTQILSQSSQQPNGASDAHAENNKEQEEEAVDWEDDKQQPDDSSGLDDESDEQDAKTEESDSRTQQSAKRNDTAELKPNVKAAGPINNSSVTAERSEEDEEDEAEEHQKSERQERNKEAKVSPQKQQAATTSPNKQTNGKPTSSQPSGVSSEDESESEESEDESEDESGAEGKTPVIQPEVVPYGQFRHLQGGNKLADRINAPLPLLPPAAVILPLSQQSRAAPTPSKPAVKNKNSSDDESEQTSSDDSDNDEDANSAKQFASRKLSLPSRSSSHTPKRTGNTALAGMFDEEAQISASQPASRQLPNSRQSVILSTPAVKKKEPPSPYEVLQGRANKQQSRRATVGEVHSGGATDRKEPTTTTSVNGAAVQSEKKRGEVDRDAKGAGAATTQKANRATDKNSQSDEKELRQAVAPAATADTKDSKHSGVKNAAITTAGSSGSGKRVRGTKFASSSAAPPSAPLPSISSTAPSTKSGPLSPPSAGGRTLHQFAPLTTSSQSTTADKGSGSGRSAKASGHQKKSRSSPATNNPPPASPTLSHSQQSTDSTSSTGPSSQLTEEEEEEEERKKQRVRQRARERYAKKKMEKMEEEKGSEKRDKDGKTAKKKRKKAADSEEEDSD